jgi:hypothetical protein
VVLLFVGFRLVVFHKLAHNGSGLGEVGELEAQKLNEPRMLIELQMLMFNSSAQIAANPMLAVV